jgi:hypothetical protein
MAPFWKEKPLGWTQGFILPESEIFYLKCENEGIYECPIARIPKKKKKKVMKIARFFMFGSNREPKI